MLGGAMIGKSASDKAAKTAANAATQSADQNAALAREQRDMMRGYVDPLVPYAYGGAAALASRTGLTRPANVFAAPTPANGNMSKTPGGFAGVSPIEADGSGRPPNLFARPAGGTPGAIDYSAVLRQRPDVKAEYDRLISTADRNSPWFSRHGLDRGAEGFAEWWTNQPGNDYAAQAPRFAPPGAPTTQPQPLPQPESADAGPAPNSPYAPYGLDGAPLTEPTVGPRADATRPGGQPPPEFAWNDPGTVQPFSFDASKIAEDPGYQFRQREAMDQVNARFGAAGLLKSGGALKGALARASDLASQETANAYARQFSAWQGNANQANANRRDTFNIFDANRRSGLDLWNTMEDRRDRNFDLDTSRGDARYDSDRAHTRSIFDTNRNFFADRFDRQTSDLFGLTNLGTGAINTLGGVGSNYVNTLTNSNNARADAIGNSAIAGANATSNLFGTAAQGIGAIYGAYKGNNPFAPKTPPGVPPSTLGSVNLGNPTYSSIFKGAF